MTNLYLAIYMCIEVVYAVTTRLHLILRFPLFSNHCRLRFLAGYDTHTLSLSSELVQKNVPSYMNTFPKEAWKTTSSAEITLHLSHGMLALESQQRFALH